jgi:hypothetical protein
MKAKQSEKIRQLADALVQSGLVTLDQQAQALGLARSTAWSILAAQHKTTGLSVSVICRMLATPQLPALVRAKLIEYIEERIAGGYGHSPQQVRKFVARLLVERRLHRFGASDEDRFRDYFRTLGRGHTNTNGHAPMRQVGQLD